MDVEFAPPSHLAMPVVDEAAADAAAQEAETEAQERLTNWRDKKNRRRLRQEDHKERRRDQRQDKIERARDRRENRRDRAEIDRCDDFDTQPEAQDYFDNWEYDPVAGPGDRIQVFGFAAEGALFIEFADRDSKQGFILPLRSCINRFCSFPEWGSA